LGLLLLGKVWSFISF